MTVAVVVLAAGASTRFGSPKQRLLIGEVLARVRAARAPDEILVVLGAHDVETDARTVRCADWEQGPGASLRCGLAALGPEVEAAAIVLADGPDLAPEALDRLIDAWHDGRGDVLAASYGGVRGHPVVLGRVSLGPDPAGRRARTRARPRALRRSRLSRRRRFCR